LARNRWSRLRCQAADSDRLHAWQVAWERL